MFISTTAGGSVSPSVPSSPHPTQTHPTHTHTQTFNCQLADLVLVALCRFYILVFVAWGCLGVGRAPLECANNATIHQTTSAAKITGQAEAHARQPGWLGSQLHYVGAF